MKDEKLIAAGGAIKALEGDRIGGYLVLWGDPDTPDLQGEYFTPETDFKLEWFDKRPVLYHHGLDGAIKSESIGVIDTITPDDTGLWIEAQLDMHNQWVRAVKELIQRGVLQWSSGSAPNLVETVKGWIKTWPIIEGSTTPSPAEPRGVNVVPLKTYLENLLRSTNVEPLASEEPGEPVIETPGAIKAEGIPETLSTEETPNQELNNMNLQDVIMSILDILAGQGVELSEEQRAAISDQVMAAYQEQAPEQAAAMAAPIEDEEKAAQVAQTLAPIVAKAAADFLTADKAHKDALKAATNGAAQAALKGAVKPASKSGGYTGGNIAMRTQYADLSAEDMSYYIKFRNATRARQGLPFWTPDSKFMRELADKAGKAYAAGELHFDPEQEAAAVKSINFLKANELDHSTQSSYGDEWVPDLWSSQVWERARMDNVILPLFQNVEMPSNPFELPVESTDPTVYYVPETTAETELLLSGSGSVIPDSKMATTKVTLTAKKLALRVGFSSELEEDSIIPWVGQLRSQALRAIEDAVDNVLLNGDTETGATGNVNLVDSTPAATAKYLAFNGIRKLYIVTNTANSTSGSGAAPTLAQIRAVRFTLNRAYATRPQDLALLCPAESYAKLLALPEFLTMDVIGNQATILNGQIGAIDGMPVLASNEFPLADTTGAVSNTGGNNLYGGLAIVYKPGWFVGYRRRVNASVDFLPYFDSYQMTATIRLAFINRDTDVAAGLYYSLV